MWEPLVRLMGAAAPATAGYNAPTQTPPRDTRRARSKREVLAEAARRVPCAFVDSPALLGMRLYGRVFWIPPQRIVGRPAAEGNWESVRRTEIELLAALRACPVLGGDWDEPPRPFTPQPVVEELFVQRLPRESTSSFQRMSQAVEAGDQLRARGCRTIEELHARFDRLEALYATIAHEGFRSQQELRRPPDDDVTVCIGRSGAVLLLRFGNHRTSIALAAGVPRIAVRVVGVHAEWVAARQAEYGERSLVRATEQGLAALLNG